MKYFFKKLKKAPYYFILLLLTLGASAIIGLLSFSGMFTLVPLLSLAIVSCILSVVYEGEIYLQNIKGSLNKLLKYNHLKNQLAKDYLLRQFTNDAIKTEADDCPQFFKDYEAQLKLLHKFSHKRLDDKSQANKRQIEKTLKDMEQWFALQLFSDEAEGRELADYEIKLRAWLKDHEQDEARELFESRNSTYNWVKGFSALAGIFMTLGISYLLVEAFTVMAIAASPAGIVVLALISGAAYSLLIYNAVTDMIHNDTLRKLYDKIRLKQGITWQSVFIALSALALLALTVALTLCTAGTWWTVAKNARPLFDWMTKIPGWIMPIIIGAAQLIFNLQNTSESLELIDNATQSEGFFKKIAKGIVDTYDQIMDSENWLQIINPFRLLLKLTVTPLRLLFFFGHLIAIGVTADRVPGIPEIASAILGIISEGFEDLHYFLGDLLHADHGHHHGTKDLLKERLGEAHGHNHSDDIPTRFIRFIFTPIYYAAVLWDHMAAHKVTKVPDECGLVQLTNETEPSFQQLSEVLQGKNAIVAHNNELFYANQRTQKIKKIKRKDANRVDYEALGAKCTQDRQVADNEALALIATLTGRHRSKPLSWEESWDKIKGQPPKESVNIKETATKPSNDWQLEQSIYRIDHYLEKQLVKASINEDLAAKKATGLKILRDDLRQMKDLSEEKIKTRISQETQTSFYGDHRFFSPVGKTSTEDFLQKLPERISAPAA